MAKQVSFSEIKDQWNPERHVDATINEASFMSSENVLVCVANSSTYSVNPNGGNSLQVSFIGLCERVGIGSSQAVQTVYEIGSSLAYRIAAQSRVTVNLASIYYQGPNLLYKLYQFNITDLGSEDVKDYVLRLKETTSTSQGDTFYQIDSQGTAGAIIYDFTPRVFRKPIGIVLFYRFAIPDSNDVSIGGFFLENTVIGTTGIDVSAGPVMMGDGVAGECEAVVAVYPQVS